MSHYHDVSVLNTGLRFANSFYVSDGGVTAEAEYGDVAVRASGNVNVHAGTSVSIETGYYLVDDYNWSYYPVTVNAPVNIDEQVSASGYKLNSGDVGATSNVSFIPIGSLRSDGTVATYGDQLTLHFKNGLYVGFTQ